MLDWSQNMATMMNGLHHFATSIQLHGVIISMLYSWQKRWFVLQSQIEESQSFFRQAFDDERLRSEHLEEQLNDMMELHQHEVTNIKQVTRSFSSCILPVFVFFIVCTCNKVLHLSGWLLRLVVACRCFTNEVILCWAWCGPQWVTASTK